MLCKHNVSRCVHPLVMAQRIGTTSGQPRSSYMNRKLNGRAILVVEAEELSAIMIVQGFEDAGSAP